MPTVPTPNRSIFASAARPDEIQNFPDWTRGWGLTFDPGQTEGIPPMEWMNSAFNQLSSASAYLLQRGLAPHDVAEDYPKDAVCTKDGTVWIARRANKNVVPGTSRDDWTVASGSSQPMFSTSWWDGKRTSIPSGSVPKDGQLLPRALYPDVVAALLSGSMPVVTEAEWLADPLKRGSYTLGDGSNTFRVPDMNGKQPGSIGAVFPRGDGANSAGAAGLMQGDAIRNIVGEFGSAIMSVGGVVNYTYVSGSRSGRGGAFNPTLVDDSTDTSTVVTQGVNEQPAKAIQFDASRAVPTANENRPVSATGCWIVWLFGDVTNAGAADAAALATAYADLASKQQVMASRIGDAGALSWRNKIINGNPLINQRGYAGGAATVAGQYTLDRWKVSGTSGITFSTSQNSVTVTIPAGQTLSQVIEGLSLTTGTYVLSWSGTAQGKIGAGAYGTSGAVVSSITGGVNTTITFNTGTVSNVQLELGSVATPFEQRPYGVELALCQRYYELGVISGIYRYLAYDRIFTFASPRSFAVTKRAPPSLIYHMINPNASGDLTSWTINYPASSGGSVTQIQADISLTHYSLLFALGTGSPIADEFYYIRGEGSGIANPKGIKSVAFDAEI